MRTNQLPQAATDMMVCLGDMPFIDSHLINRLVDSHLGLADRWSHITLPLQAGIAAICYLGTIVL